MAIDRKPRISLIYKNETRASNRAAREAGGPVAGDGRDPARIAAGADHPQPRPQLRQMRQRRGTPDVGVDGELPRRARAAVQSAPRNGAASAPLAGELSAAEAVDRGDLRAQSRAAAPGRGRRRVAEERLVIERRRAQRSFGDGLIAGEVKDLREVWMNHA